MVSTVDDYLAFGQMMLAKGQYKGERVLSSTSVEAMTADQLTPEQQVSAGFFLGGGRGWGLGVSILTEGEDSAASSRFGWEGGLGTAWYSDPGKDTVAILMTQVLGLPSHIDADFRAWLFQTPGE